MKKEIIFAHFPKSNFKRYQQLLAAFSNLDNAWEAEFGDLKNIGWKDEIINEFLLWKDKFDAEKAKNILKQEGIKCITQLDDDYPPLLKEIYDPPFCLFVRGDINNISNPIAVVGPRKFSPYGKQITEELVSELTNYGVEIISGLAFGIDSIAHNSTLKSNGRTIAVLGSGINKKHISPVANVELSERIINSGGAIMSEYPPGGLASKYTFPRRNRIVAGISLGTLVIEATEKSGALITAQCALDNSREVFVVPQNITSRTSIGSNKLLKIGATPITEAADILNSLNLEYINKDIAKNKTISNSPTEAKIIECLSKEPVHVDIIIKKTSLPSQTINSALILMEMNGIIKNMGSMMYILRKSI